MCRFRQKYFLQDFCQNFFDSVNVLLSKGGNMLATHCTSAQLGTGSKQTTQESNIFIMSIIVNTVRVQYLVHPIVQEKMFH